MKIPDDAAAEEDRMYESVLNAVFNTEKKDYPSYVGGVKIASGRSFDVSSPIDRTIIFGRFQEPDEGLVDRAVEAAGEAYDLWSEVSPAERAGYFETANDYIKKQRYRLAGILTLNTGMVRKDALEEVDRLIEIIDDACAFVREGECGDPAGVWGVITSYNSPLAAPMGFAISAMIEGNTVVMIPSGLVPMPVYSLYNILETVRLPAGVLNLIADRTDASAKALANSTELEGIAFSGSGELAEDMMFMQMNEDLAFVNETKGMNPILVYKPANMKEAARLVVDSMVLYSGQRADATSKVVVTADESDAFQRALLLELKSIKVGDPTEKETTMGPVISEKDLERLLCAAESYRDNLLFGGKRLKGEFLGNGYFVTPAVFTGLPEEYDLNNMDNSLPVLSIQIARDLEDAVELINSSEFGVSAGIITKDESAADFFLGNVLAENVFINDSSRVVGTAPNV